VRTWRISICGALSPTFGPWAESLKHRRREKVKVVILNINGFSQIYPALPGIAGSIGCKKDVKRE
jgi:hypothetical protein